MIYVSVDNTFEYELLDGLSKLKAPHMKTTELFGSLQGLSPTRRSGDRIPYRGIPELKNYVKKANSLGIELSWTLTSISEQIVKSG